MVLRDVANTQEMFFTMKNCSALKLARREKEGKKQRKREEIIRESIYLFRNLPCIYHMTVSVLGSVHKKSEIFLNIHLI